jgi:ABC-2 type transport system permease protein
MSEVLLIVRREFLERVRSKAFVIGTVLFPVFLVVTAVLPLLLDGGGDERRIALVDESPAGIGAGVAAALAAAPQGEDDDRYAVERIAAPLERVRGELNARVQAEELDGYVVIPPDVLEGNRVLYRARSIANAGVLRDIRRAASQAVQAERLRAAGLDGGELAALIRPVQVDEARITGEGEEGGDAMSTFFVAYILLFLVYFMVVFYGNGVMRSVLEEKTNRIVEVMVSSVRAGDLMLGKILGVGAAALLQVAIWAAFVAVAASRSEALAARFGLEPGALHALRIEPAVGMAFVGFFVLGFLLYAALFAALGAAVTSEQEAQSLQFTVLFPLVLPMIFMIPMIEEPMGSMATALGLIPLTSPLVMPMRMALVPVPPLQLGMALALLMVAVPLVAWVAGKIYRVGILATGKKPTLRELAAWLRAA